MIHARLFRSSGSLTLSLIVIGTSLLTAPYSQAGVLTTLTFDDPTIPFQSIDDFTLLGVTFDYKIAGVDSPEAHYKSGGPGTLTFVDDPSLAGDSAGVLTLTFDHPTPTLQFGVALNTGSSLSPGFQVELFDANQASLGVIPVDVASAAALGFSEGLFEHTGAAISRAVIDFQHEPGFFALDNLTYEVIPEPTTALLGAFAALGIASLRRSSRHGV